MIDDDFQRGGEMEGKNKYKLIQGAMQSRKSWVIICIVIYYHIVYSIPVVIVVENKTNACIQLAKRLLSVYNLKLKRGKDISRRDKGFTYICLRNEYDLEPVIRKLKGYVAILDECDSIDCGISSNAQECIDALKLYSRWVWNISATPITTLIKEEIFNKNVVLLNDNVKYKGINNFKIVPLLEKITLNNSEITDPIDYDLNLEKYISDFSRRKNDIQPSITLIKIGNFISHQEKIAFHIRKKYKNITCLTFNGGTYGVKLYGEKIEKIGDSIGEVLEKLQIRKNKKNIIIIAGKMADRGITFCSLVKEKPWHLTEMYYVTGLSTDQPTILQACGRLCGIWDDEIELVLYTNIPNDVKKSYLLQSKILNESINKEGLMNHNIQKVEIGNNEHCRRRITARGIQCKLNVEGVKISKKEMFLGLMERNKLYCKGEVLELLCKAGFNQPSSYFKSITDGGKYGPGCILERVGDNFKLV